MATAFNFHTRVLAPGVNFTAIKDERFKTNYLGINLITKLEERGAAARAVLPIVLSKSCEAFPDLSLLSRQLNALYGASLSGDAFKMGDCQVVSLSVSSIADRYALEGEALAGRTAALLLECLLHPRFENGVFGEKSFGLCRQELVDAIEGEINDKRIYASLRAAKTIYKNEPAALSAYGDREAAAALTPTEATAAWREMLSNSIIEIVSAGGGDIAQQEMLLAGAFSGLNRSPENFKAFGLSPLKPTEEVTERLEVSQSKLVMALKRKSGGAPMSDKDLAAVRVANAIFGGGTVSKLFTEVREKLSLCYYCSSVYEDLKDTIIVNSGIEHENILKAKDAILEQFNKVASGNFSSEDLEAAILYLANRYRSVGDSPYALASWYFKQGFKSDGSKALPSPEEELRLISGVTGADIVKALAGVQLDTVYVLTGKEEQ